MRINFIKTKNKDYSILNSKRYLNFYSGGRFKYAVLKVISIIKYKNRKFLVTNLYLFSVKRTNKNIINSLLLLIFSYNNAIDITDKDINDIGSSIYDYYSLYRNGFINKKIYVDLPNTILHKNFFDSPKIDNHDNIIEYRFCIDDLVEKDTVINKIESKSKIYKSSLDHKNILTNFINDMISREIVYNYKSINFIYDSYYGLNITDINFDCIINNKEYYNNNITKLVASLNKICKNISKDLMVVNYKILFASNNYYDAIKIYTMTGDVLELKQNKSDSLVRYFNTEIDFCLEDKLRLSKNFIETNPNKRQLLLEGV